jgi:hypothetical protein
MNLRNFIFPMTMCIYPKSWELFPWHQMTGLRNEVRAS